MFSYDFVSLSPEQVKAMRQQLDQAGYQAYAASVLLLIISWSFRTLKRTASYASREEDGTKPSHLTHLSRSVAWLLDTTYIAEFGPLKIQLLGLLYTAFLLWRITYQTGNNYMHVTKAFGHVAVSQLPMHYLLSIKWPYSPITTATGLTHESLNAYHRLFGRIVHSLFAMHAVLYLRFFIKMDLLAKRIKDTDVRLGILAFWSMNFLALLSIPPIRRKAYHALFYRSHIILSGIFIPILWYHVAYTRIYVAQAALIWLLNSFLRNGASLPATISCTSVSQTLVSVKATVTGHHLYPYLPGVHIYLNIKPFGPRTPFTVVSARALSQDSPTNSTNPTTEIDLVARISNGPMTSTLASLTSSSPSTANTPQLHLEGPYGASRIILPPLLHAATLPPSLSGKFLLVAAGIGATHTLPLYTALCAARTRAKQPVDDIRMLWIVRDESDVSWAGGFRETCVREGWRMPFVRVTSTASTTSKDGTSLQDEKKGSQQSNVVKEVQRGGRPDLAEFVDDFVNERLISDGNGVRGELKKEVGKTGEKRLYKPVTVLVCGPDPLVRNLRSVMGKYVFRDGRDVRWHEEAFGFGGS